VRVKEGEEKERKEKNETEGKKDGPQENLWV